MTESVAIPMAGITPEVLEKTVIGGDLSGLNAAQRTEYYAAVCRSLGLNPLTKPFEYLTLNGKLRLYALRDCADQLRKLHGISIYIANREKMNDVYVVTARARDREGREDESTGVVPLKKGGNELTGEDLANALMKCETKAKRRVTLSIAGLGWLDETEMDTIPERSMQAGPAALPLASNAVSPDEINSLVTLATSLGIDAVTFAIHMRRVMDLPEDARITKKLLRECMTRAQYEAAWNEYSARLAAEIEQDVPLGDGIETPESSQDVRLDPDPSSVDAPTGEAVTTGQPDSKNGHANGLASTERIKAVMTYAEQHNLGSLLNDALKRWPDGISTQALERVYANLQDRVEAQGQQG